jgi:ferredoxin-type protein NapH
VTALVARALRGRRRRLPGGKLWLQVLRRLTQLGVLALLVAIPTVSLYDNLRNQRDDVGIAAHPGARLVRDLVAGIERPERVTQLVRGSVWTLKVGDLVISDPLAVVDFAGAARQLIDSFALSALIPLVLTLLLGRIFCGWICPADLLLEAGSVVRRWIGISTDVTFARPLKFAALGLGLVAGLALATQVFATLYPPRMVSAELYQWVTFGTLGAGSWFLLLLLAFEIFVSRRFWCRYVCPGGGLYALLGRYRVVRLKVDQQRCTRCDKCNTACEYGLDPMNGRFGDECNNCGQCVRACGPDALTWRFSLRPAGGRDVIGDAPKEVGR